MLLYKFKSAQDSLYALDIAIHERLFCANYTDLNDPFEGQFRAVVAPAGFMQFGQGFGQQSGRMIYSDLTTSSLSGPSRVCSLSAAWHDVRMWALYADSFRGMAFEFEIDENEPELHQVTYATELPKLNIGLLMPSETIEALTHKTTHWDYESEWRFISHRTYINLPGKLNRILLGSRVSDTVREAVLKVAPSHCIVQMVGLNPEGVSMSLGHQLERQV